MNHILWNGKTAAFEMHVKSGDGNSECCLCVTLWVWLELACATLMQFIRKHRSNLVYVWYRRQKTSYYILFPWFFWKNLAYFNNLPILPLLYNQSVHHKWSKPCLSKQTFVGQTKLLSVGKWKVLSREWDLPPSLSFYFEKPKE